MTQKKGLLSLIYGVICMGCAGVTVFGWKPEPSTVAFYAFMGAALGWLCMSRIERNLP